MYVLREPARAERVPTGGAQILRQADPHAAVAGEPSRMPRRPGDERRAGDFGSPRARAGGGPMTARGCVPNGKTEDYCLGRSQQGSEVEPTIGATADGPGITPRPVDLRATSTRKTCALKSAVRVDHQA
jgi:hypothetical protein